MQMSGTSRGWREARRLAGRQFAQATDLGGSAEQLTGSVCASQDKVLVRLRQMRDELTEWIDMIEADPVEGHQEDR